MGFYARVIFPRLMDWALSRPFLHPYRQETLAQVEGEVLELGFGTGLNLAYYPEGLKSLTVVEPNEGMGKLARRRLKALGLEIVTYQVKGESLPLPDKAFDAVVSTWTLCSVDDPEKVLKELWRLLKGGGRLFFLEHGLSRDEKVSAWQKRLTPLQIKLADGCHLDRDMKALMEAQGFKFLRLQEFYMAKLPQVGGYMYQGVAVKV